jgi:uncharacterized protein (TIGR02300 family)
MAFTRSAVRSRLAPPPFSEGRKAPRPAPVEEVEAVVPETADVELVSLEDADAEAQGKKTAPAEGEAAPAEEEVEIDESLDDAAFIEEQEEGDPDVSDIIGEGIEKEEET